MVKSMLMHKRESKKTIKSIFVTLCLVFRGSILILFLLFDVRHHNSAHVDTTFSLCPMGLWGQINKHPSQGQTNPHIGVDDRL